MSGVIPQRDDDDMQAAAYQAKHSQPPLAVIPPRVLHRHSRVPFKIDHTLEWQPAFRNVPVVLGGVERDSRVALCYS